MVKRHYGWKPDLPDKRDHIYAHKKFLGLINAPLPPSTNLSTSKFMPPVYDQGQLGSCTGNATTAAVEFELARNSIPSAYGQIPYVPKSRLYAYYNGRDEENDVSQDNGAQLRDVVKGIVQYGICSNVLWPYDITQFAVKPPAAAYTDGKSDAITQYQRLTSLYDMKHCLASGYPFVFGFTVYSSFESNTVAGTGIVPMPGPDEDCLGGHAVMAVGYDDAKQMMLVRNSWGSLWGQGGYFWLPYAYISDNNLADDFWQIQK